ncbi:MAG: hypothetical protein PHC85_00105 [Candidatus Pacebacteria bacterium]|nr:hypothetical protein [Candidatus Paceibacterota bacterium]
MKNGKRQKTQKAKKHRERHPGENNIPKMPSLLKLSHRVILLLTAPRQILGLGFLTGHISSSYNKIYHVIFKEKPKNQQSDLDGHKRRCGTRHGGLSICAVSGIKGQNQIQMSSHNHFG